MSDEKEPTPQWERITSVADLMPEVMAIFGRVAQKWKLFQDDMRIHFDRAPAFIACKQHPKQQLWKQFEESCQKSFQASLKKPIFIPVYAACPLCVDAETKERRRRFWAKRGIPERLLEADERTVQCGSQKEAEVKFQIIEWMKQMKGFLLLVGPVGTGKSQWATIALKAMGDGLFITHADMLSDLRSSYATHTTADVMERWKEAELFVLDEFGLSATGKDEEPMLYQVLAYRHDKRKPTIITSNCDLDTIRGLLGPRLLDRIREDLTEIPMNWPSYRQLKRGNA